MNPDRPRQLLMELVRQNGSDLKAVSAAIGKNHAYIQQYFKRGVPRTLPEEVREALAAHFGVDPDDFRPGGAPMKRGRFRANRVRLLREREGWSEQDLALRLGWTPTKVQRIERGQKDLTITEVYALADALQVHRIEIFEDLPYSPRVRDVADRISGLSENAQETVIRVIDALMPSSAPPEPERASSPAAQKTKRRRRAGANG